MTPAEMKTVRQRFGLTQLELARLFRLHGKNNARTIRRIESGTQAATGPIMLLYELLHDGCLDDYLARAVEGREQQGRCGNRHA